MDQHSFPGSEQRSRPNGGFQFSLGALFLLMTAAAVVLAGIMALAAALGVDASGAVFQAVSQQVLNLPRTTAYLVAIVMLFNRGPRHSPAARYGLIGFSGLLLVTLMGLAFQILIQALMGNLSGTSLGAIFGIYGFANSALSAVCYGFLLAAILSVQRSAATATGSVEGLGDPTSAHPAPSPGSER